MSSDEAKFTPVSPQLVGACWDRAKPLIEKACEMSNGRFTIESVASDLSSGAQVLWILYRGDDDMLMALTTAVSHYPDRTFLNVMFCGADGREEYFKQHRDLIVSSISAWAKMHNCSGVEISGRPGWERILAPAGYKKAYTVLELEF